MNFLEQILHFEGITSRHLHSLETIKLTGDIEKDIARLEAMIKDFEYYAKVFRNALLRFEYIRDDKENGTFIPHKDYDKAIKWDKVNE